MKSSELRIGNLVNIGYDCKVCGIDEFGATLNTYNGVKDLIYFHQSDIKPILLTEYWLRKLSFSPLDGTFSGIFMHKSKLFVRFIYDFEKSTLKDKVYKNTLTLRAANIDFNPEIKYVHQIQNLYFSLTGQELTIK